MPVSADHRHSTDVFIDITLYFELALLAWIFLMWDRPARPLPPLFQPPSHAITR
jgi:hypothetical protein